MKRALAATSTDMSHFATTILNGKYAHIKKSGHKETWPEIAERVAYSVMGPYCEKGVIEKVRKLIERRIFMPGGRYLYAAGKKYPQINNCFDGDTRFITKTGAMSLAEACDKQVEVLNRHGKWETATVKHFGKQQLHKVNFTNGDTVLATASHRWWTKDGQRVTTMELETVPFAVHEKLPSLDEEGIRHGIVYGDGCVPAGSNYSHVILCTKEKESLATYFKDEVKTVKLGNGGYNSYKTVRKVAAGLKVALQSPDYKKLPDKVTPAYARGFIAGLIATDGSTKTSSVTISCEGMTTAQRIRELAVLGGCVVNGIHIASVISPYTKQVRELCVVGIKPFSAPIIRADQQQDLSNRELRQHKMYLTVDSIEEYEEKDVYCVVAPESESFTLANGVITSNCFLWITEEDSREGWADTMYKNTSSLMTGGGVGNVYSNIRGEGEAVGGLGGVCTGPIALMQMVNEAGRHIMQGGSRRSAIWAGLNWKHPDIAKFIKLKDWSPEVKALKLKDFNFPATMDGTNISVGLDDAFFTAFDDWGHPEHQAAQTVYWSVIRSACESGEPGFSVDVGLNAGEVARNACTELSSKDDGDCCNLASINLARIATIEELEEVVYYGTAFQLCGTMYSPLPLERMYKVREKNRRLGMGLMGVHEWLLRRGYNYAVNSELGQWLAVYAKAQQYAEDWSDKVFSISRPVKTRAIAPTGTIAIVAETTGGMEPIFAVAMKRRYLNQASNKEWKYQYIVDAAAQRLIDDGVDPHDIEDAYELAEDVERRIEMQSWIQQYVDHGISSTINMPKWGSSNNNPDTINSFGTKLMKYLPTLRGITVYPDESRGGQPLNRVSYQEAVRYIGQEFTESGETADQTVVEEVGNERSCVNGLCGI